MSMVSTEEERNRERGTYIKPMEEIQCQWCKQKKIETGKEGHILKPMEEIHVNGVNRRR